MNIRPAVRADLPAILDIYNWAVLNTAATNDYEPHTLEMRIAWFDSHLRDNYPVFVAQTGDGQIVGWSSLSRYRERIGYRFTVEDSVYVAPDSRGVGVGTALLPPLIEAGRQLGLHAIVAGIDSDNEASIRLHARFGFEKVACFKEVGYKFDRWLSVVYMELLFT